MLTLFFAASVLLFPSVAVWALQTGGSRRLFQTTAAVSLIAVGAGLFAASNLGGNRLVTTYGYTYTAVTNVIAFTLVAVLPIVATAIVVWLLSPRLSGAVLFIVAAVTCLVSLLCGTMVMVYAAYAVWR